MSNTINFFHKGLIHYRYIQLLLVIWWFNVAFKLCSLLNMKKLKQKKAFITKVKIVTYCNDLFPISKEQHYLQNCIILTKKCTYKNMFLSENCFLKEKQNEKGAIQVRNSQYNLMY